MRKKSSKALASVLALMMVLTSGGCAAGNNQSSAAPSSAAQTSSAAQNQKVTIKLFSNLPDRKSGQGLLEQKMIDSYQAANPNVTIQVEALQDDPYKQKFKAYLTGNNLPDIYNIWGQPAFFEPVMKAGYAAELNKGDYDADNFLPGSLDGFSLDGKLYGLPRNSDFTVLYYNKKIMSDNGIALPTKTSDLVDAAKKLQSKGISLISIGGKEKWPLAIMYNAVVQKETGSDKVIRDAITNKSFDDAALLKAAKDFQDLCQAGIFQKSYTTDDTGTAKNIFAQGKTAMFYSGEWDMGMKTSPDYSDDFKNNLEVTPFPLVEGCAGKATDIMAWNGGGYAVSSKSPNKEAAIKFLNYIAQPENWTKIGWENGLIFPAQKFDSYMTGKESTVQTGLTKILSGATSLSGTPINDSATSQFKTDSETAVQELAAKMITPEKFIAALNDSVKKSS